MQSGVLNSGQHSIDWNRNRESTIGELSSWIHYQERTQGQRGKKGAGNPPGIEGSTLKTGDRCIILEDVTTTGGSALKACEILAEIGCQVVGCITILDREEGGEDAFGDADIPLHPLLRLSDIRA